MNFAGGLVQSSAITSSSSHKHTYAWSDVSSKVLMGFDGYFGLDGERWIGNYLSPSSPKYPWNPIKTF